MRSLLPVVLAVLCWPAAPAWAQAEPSEADPAMREKGVALAADYVNYGEIVSELNALEKKWKAKKVWKEGRKANITASEDGLEKAMACIAGGEAGIATSIQTGDIASAGRWSNTVNFFKFILYAQAGKLDFKFNQAENLEYPGATRIKLGLNQRGFSDAEIAGNYQYCQIAEQYLLRTWNLS